MIQLWCWLKWSEKLFPRTSTTFLWIEAGDQIFTFNQVFKVTFRHCETTGTGAISMEIYQIIAYKKFTFKAFPTKSCASALGWGNLVETGGLILHRLWVTKQCCQTNLNTCKGHLKSVITRRRNWTTPWGLCQIKLTWDGAGGLVASPYDKTLPIQVL